MYELKRDRNNNHWIKVHIKKMHAESDIWININNISVIRVVSEDYCKVIMNANIDDKSLQEFEADKKFMDTVFFSSQLPPP